MADITAAMVKELRDATGAGMLDAKKALVENGGDMEKSVDWLRQKGLSKAAKKSGRVAAEGLVAVAKSGHEAVVLEINSETDFLSRNSEFQDFVKKTSEVALEKASSIEELAAAPYGNGKNVQDTLTNLIATIGENMSLRRLARLSVSKGVVATYIHNSVAENLGKIGVLVALESDLPADKLESLGKQLAMHIAATNPAFLDKDAVDSSVLERERNVIRATAKEQGKPDDIIEKMLDGRVRKFYEEVCLLEQTFVMDGETRISKVIDAHAKEHGGAVKLTGYVRFQLGEGIEKEETDFAAEVAKAANG